MPKFYSRSYNNSPDSGYVLTSDVNGLVSWTASTNTGLATASGVSLGGVIIGSGLTVSNSGILSLSSGGGTTYIAGVGLTLSGSTFSLISVNTKRIYVSVNGSDLNDGLTDATPFLNIKTARDLAVAGNTIIVMPGTYIYDNRSSNSNYWNSRIDDINLWKNGITYYFESGSKIIIYNQTVVGAEIALFRPRGVVFETCNVYGYLEFELGGVGVDTINGYSYFFNGNTVDPIDPGYTCYLQLRSLYSTTNNPLYICRGVTASNKSIVTVTADSYTHIYTTNTGQSGSGASIMIWGSTTGIIEYNQNIRYILSQINTVMVFRGDLSYSMINVKGDSLISNSRVAFQIQPSGSTSSSYLSGQGVMNVDVKKIYFTGPAQNYGCVVHNVNASIMPFILNLSGDCVEYAANGNSKTLFFISGSTTANRVINYTGNIYTITSSGETSQSLYSQGRRISYVSGLGSVLNFKGDINYNGSLVTLKEVFKTAYSGVINYSGNMRGNFGCPITKCNSGEINIYNSSIISDIDSSYSSIISNGFNYINSNGGLNGNFELCKIKIQNSYIRLRNSGNYIGNGGYINAIVSNSTIINSGTAGFGIINSTPYYADPLTNGSTSDSTSTGLLQMSNSTIISATSSIYYTGSSSVISINSGTNTDIYVYGGLKGSIDIITELNY